jgi:hypothetical protein
MPTFLLALRTFRLGSGPSLLFQRAHMNSCINYVHTLYQQNTDTYYCTLGGLMTGHSVQDG